MYQPNNQRAARPCFWRDTAFLVCARRQSLLCFCRAEVNSLYERLFFENVLTELGESSEVIYLSVANAALAHLPYLVALDHQSRQVALAS